MWQKYEVEEAKEELAEVKKTIGKLEEEIVKLKKAKAHYKNVVMESDQFKPCLALVDKERRLARRAIAHVGATNRDIMV